MSKNPAIMLVEAKHLKKNVPEIKPGDVVRVHQKIVEAGKERIQIFEGLVIAVSGSRGIDGSFKVRKIASGVGVERTFPLHSPKVTKIERVKSSKVRRAKLYYIRALTGRKARLRADSYEAGSWEESTESEKNVAKNAEIEKPEDSDFETLDDSVTSDNEGTEATIELEPEEKA